jgi:hypothetical protein
VRLATIGLGLALVLGSAAPATHAAPPTGRPPRAPKIYHKSKSFRIPFNVDPAERSRLKEVQLWVSSDQGFTWEPKSKTTPDRPSFTFRAARDGEYWFAVRTLDVKGQLYPSEDSQVEPSMKVIVDSTPPSLLLEPDTRRGSLASVRWEVRDEHLDPGSLVLEYQAEGARDWRQVPIRRPSLIGSESWDAGTAEPLKVRASISDRAGNTTDEVTTLPEGTPTNPGLASHDSREFAAPPPISHISSGPSFTPVDEGQRALDSQDPLPPPAADAENPFGPDGGDPFAGSRGNGNGNGGGGGDPFAAPGGSGGGAARAPIRSPAPRSQRLLVASPEFPLKYAVDDAGPNGPNSVGLWVTQDGGRTWSLRAEDDDRVSPFLVDLGGEGTFGLCLVARSASGLGDQPPAPGDPPQIWVEVDNTPPSVLLNPPIVGTGKNVGKVAITWRATDFHLGQRPIVLQWRPDQPGASWQPITPEPIENSGRFIWNVPPNAPPRLHLRIEASDTLGNRGAAETTETGSVLVDRTRPRSRILGLDKAELSSGGAPSARPLR